MAGKRPLKLRDGVRGRTQTRDSTCQGLAQTIAHYIGVGRHHEANYIVDKPIFQSCVEGMRRHGSSAHQFWWEQSMDLEAARVALFAGPVAVFDDEEEYAFALGVHPAGVLLW
jgi:hypothetical protein